MLQALVYEKQHKLRIMMKMHGLGDRAYWTISYGYFAIVSSIYMLCFVAFGSLLGNITCIIYLLRSQNPFKFIIHSFYFFFFGCRTKFLYIQWLHHPVCVLFCLCKLASFCDLSSGRAILQCQDSFRCACYLLNYLISCI